MPNFITAVTIWENHHIIDRPHFINEVEMGEEIEPKTFPEFLEGLVKTQELLQADEMTYVTKTGVQFILDHDAENNTSYLTVMSRGPKSDLSWLYDLVERYRTTAREDVRSSVCIDLIPMSDRGVLVTPGQPNTDR